MDNIYSTLILDHNRSKHNKRELNNPDHIERGHNPSCGDDLTLQVNIVDGLVSEAAYIGTGCAISQASMSIMIDIVKGLPVDKAKKLAESFFKMVQGQEITDEEKETLEDAVAFDGLHLMPARAKCGTLGWHCLDEILMHSH